MIIGMKFASRDGDMFLSNLRQLEEEGVPVKGFEIQVTGKDNEGSVSKAVEHILDQFDFKKTGLHPPFPAYADQNFIRWAGVARKLNLDYTVLHASINHSNFADLQSAVRNAVQKSKGLAALENVPIRGERAGAGTLIETALLHDSLILDIPHTIYNWENERRTNLTPVEQVRKTLDVVDVVHVADHVKNAEGAVPRNGGSKMFQGIMNELFKKKGILLMAEPTGGHLHGGEGHKETCREIHRLWLKK